ncbi:MAG: Zn-ribbon domain-containing OB-fold protein [Dehalococcoidia bacterium]
MTQEKPRYVKPLPVPNTESAPFWDACKEHRLQVQRCKRCSQFYFYPRSHCPFCHQGDVEWVQCSGKGRVHTFTVVRQNMAPGFREEVPYVVAIVELEEDGVQLMANIVECDSGDVSIGMPVQVAFDDVTEEVTLARFKPA